MGSQSHFVMTRRAKITLVLLVLAGTGFLGIVISLNSALLWERAVAWYALVRDQEQVKAFLMACGPVGAPAAFVGTQILQVVFAPIPGEASGFVGGYLFGTFPGFTYSTIGLTAGSVINFAVGRMLGRRYVEKWIPSDNLLRFDALARHQGAILFFVFFILPGFPKDYLCLFLGLTSISLKVFTVMTCIGRMPGTLMLSLQGAHVFQQDYATLALLIGITLVLVGSAWFWRQRIYKWIDRLNHLNSQMTEP